MMHDRSDSGRYSVRVDSDGNVTRVEGPATRRAAMITHPEMHRLVPTAPERTISGNQPIHPVVVKGMIEQQRAADRCLRALNRLLGQLVEA